MIWKPHKGPQEFVLQRQEFEVLYGGARGGGKTDAGLVWMTDCINNPRFRGLVIRKNADDLSDWIDRAKYMYSPMGAKFAYRPVEITFPSGAKIKTGHLKDESAYTKYQGHEYQRMLIEELTQIPDEKRYLMLLGSCRSTVDGLKPQIFMTTNPGGVGHGWVMDRFNLENPANWGKVMWFNTKLPNGMEARRSRIFVPARLEDNPTLMEKDPGYVATLEMLKEKDPDLYKAWREGRWDVFAGQFFKTWKVETHVIRQLHRVNPNLHIIGGLDWGRVAPFSFHLAVIYPVDVEVDGYHYRFYRTVTFLEVYGTDKTPAEWSQEIKEAMNLYNLEVKNINFVKADNRIFVPGDDKSISIYDQFCAEDENWRGVIQPCSKDRIGGWENMQNWMSLAPDNLPYWLVTSNCSKLIYEIPKAVHDETIVEDLYAEYDHALDDQQYMLKGTKWIDAKVAAIKSGGAPKQVPGIKTAIMELDTDAFATTNPGKIAAIN